MNDFQHRFKHLLLFPLILLLAGPFSAALATGQNNTNDDQELDQLIEQLEPITADIEKTIKEIETGLAQQEQNGIRNRNKILWSIPAGFPEDAFDENIKNLHVNIPLYGKVKLPEEAYKKYIEFLNKINKTYSIDKTEDFFRTGLDAHKKFQTSFSPPTESMETLNTIPAVSFLHNFAQKVAASPVRNVYAPGLKLYDYITGKNIPGLGFYRSDLNEIGFLAANMASAYLLFKDIKKAKLDKVKASINSNKNEFIRLIEHMKNDTDKKVREKTKKEIKSLISKHCALFIYNPCKREIVLPLLKYIFFQRIIENIKSDQPQPYSNPDQQFAFIKNEKGELVRSGVTPISLVPLTRVFVAPIAEFSRTTSKTLYNTGRSLRFIDRLFGQVHLPLRFYRLFSSIVGESLVLVMIIKIMDSYFNDQLLNAIVAHPDTWLSALKDSNQIDTIDYPSQEQANQLLLHQDRLAKEINHALSSGKTGFWSWIQAQRAMFLKISIAGFLCFIVPSLVIKGIPLVMNKMKQYGGIT